MAPPDEPPLLLVATVRSDAPMLKDSWLDPARGQATVHHLDVERLPAEDALNLAQRLLKLAPASSPLSAQQLVKETAGHPLFLRALAYHAVSQGIVDAARLDDAVWDRVQKLPASAQRLLHLTSVMSRPLPLELARQAGPLDAQELNRSVAQLRAGYLLRASSKSGGHGSPPSDAQAVEPYHDRVREIVVSRLGPEQQQALHRDLALAMEQSTGADPEALAYHFDKARLNDKTARYALEAAEGAAAALAFERAARFYRLALQLQEQSADPQMALSPRRDLQIQLGVALGNAGRGAESGRAFLNAAALAPPEQRRELQCRAASQLMRAGHLDDGTEHLRQALAAVGLKLPRSPRHTLLLLLWRRAQLALRGLHYKERPDRPLTAEMRARLDACRIAASGLAMSDIICGAMFQSHYVLLALQSGDLSRIASGLIMEAAFRAGAGGPGWKQTRKVLDLAQSLAERLGDSASRGQFHMNCGVAHHLIGRFDVAARELQQGEALLRQHGIDISWELDTCKLFSAFNDVYLGELGRLAQRLPQLIEEAEQRDDLYSLTNFRVCPWPMVCLAHDRPDEAFAIAEASLGRWSSRGFHLEHYNTMQALTQTELYRGEGRAALRRAEAGRRQARSALLLQIQNVRIEIADLIGAAALAAALQAPAEAARYLKQAEREAYRLESERMDWSLALAARLRAAVAAARGEREPALGFLRSAIERFEQVHMAMYGAAVRLRFGVLLGGSAGAAEVQKAEAAMTAQGVVAPRRFAGLLAPGFPS